MALAFDLISDLHVETWEGTFDWSDRATSPYCVVAGDVARDRSLAIQTLAHLGRCYQAVFYIDGNDEHRNYMEDLDGSYRSLARQLSQLKNVVYLQDNVAVVDNIAFVGTNGWWGWDFDMTIDPTESAIWFQAKHSLSSDAIKRLTRMSNQDSTYLSSSVKRLQTHNDVKKIVIVTHTVPDPALIEHDIGLVGKHKFNQMGNSFIGSALSQDTENKIHTWCFGHYHGSVDQIRNNARFVNNCRGRGDTEFCQHVYHPKRIVIDF